MFGLEVRMSGGGHSILLGKVNLHMSTCIANK